MKPPLLLTAAVMLCMSSAWAAPGQVPQPADTFIVQPAAPRQASSADALVEAVRAATVSAQVAGTVVSLSAKPGDRVAAGQELARIDARAAQQNAAASAAQVDAARAAQDVAAKEYERQQQLFQKQYISQAALDRAQAQWRASQAQVRALAAQAAAAATQSGFHTIKAPFAGIVSSVPANVGDTAGPGTPLLTLFDPSLMRVTGDVAQQQAAALRSAGGGGLQIDIPGLASPRITVPAAKVQVLPTADSQSHTVQVRAELPPGVEGVVPGMFARLWLNEGPGASPSPQAASGPLRVPATAVVRRAEMTGVYVLDAEQRPLLRQVRLGRPVGDMVEVLSGLRVGDRVALSPSTAAKGR